MAWWRLSTSDGQTDRLALSHSQTLFFNSGNETLSDCTSITCMDMYMYYAVM